MHIIDKYIVRHRFIYFFFVFPVSVWFSCFWSCRYNPVPVMDEQTTNSWEPLSPVCFLSRSERGAAAQLHGSCFLVVGSALDEFESSSSKQNIN